MCKSEFKLDEKGISTLYVDGKPFFMRSGEIHNSSASTLEEMENQIWPQIRELNLNSLIVPIYWECIEKEEDIFDFTLIDGIVDQARKEAKKG
jgi:beta-galactosidase GanA